MKNILKSVKIHKFIFNIVYNFNSKRKLKNFILFESHPDLTDNTKSVFDKMIEWKINEKYKFIWIVKDKNRCNNINVKNVVFVEKNNKYKKLYYRLNSKYIIDCNLYIKKMHKNQFRIHLTHGMPMKAIRSYFEEIGEVDFLTVTSTKFISIISNLYNINENKIIVTGFPRSDCFFKKNNNIEKKIKIEFGNNKYIVWLPTYRNHKEVKEKNEYNMDIHFKYGVPVLEKENELMRLNEILKSKKIDLFIKLHPAENSETISHLNLSNINLISDEQLFEKGISLYQFLKYSSALITDYSSVYYDYQLTKKPIGLSISDIEEYTKHVKLIFDNYEKNIEGKYIYKFNDLINFVNFVDENNDKPIDYKIKYNDYYDGNSSERVVNLLGIEGEEGDK